MKKVFISGANGFVGRYLCRHFDRQKIFYRAGVRAAENTRQFPYGDLTEVKDWSSVLNGCDKVVHLANRAHVMTETTLNPLTAFRHINTDGTFRFAEACRQFGIKRFIFLSSVKVNGEDTNHRTPFTADETPNPQDPYAISKLEAEQKLMTLHQPGKFEVVILRPPLIYGRNVKGNLQNLMHLIQKKWPLPFASVHNKRSLVSAANLCDLISTCLEHPAASGQIFLASDDADLSLAQLIRKLAVTLKTSVFLIPVPVFLMKSGAAILGKSAYADRLFGDLQLDIEKTKQLLNWKPPYTFEDTFENPLPQKNRTTNP